AYSLQENSARFTTIDNISLQLWSPPPAFRIFFLIFFRFRRVIQGKQAPYSLVVEANFYGYNYSTCARSCSAATRASQSFQPHYRRFRVVLLGLCGYGASSKLGDRCTSFDRCHRGCICSHEQEG